MIFNEIDFDEEKLKSSMCKREKLVLYLMALMLIIVGKPKFTHQLKNFMSAIFEE